MKNVMYTPHFTALEFTESATARKYGIENRPTPEAVANLKRLCMHTLEPLREALGLPVIITSGFRCKALNDIIAHHSHRSQHLKGQAADFYVGWIAPPKGRGQSGPSSNSGIGSSPRERLIKAFRLIITSEQIDFDQLILYPNFIHVSYVAPEANRHYIMVAQGNGRYGRVTKETALTFN
jgi:hypothetical protein